MFIRVWRFRATSGKEAEFERFNGPDGEWARLFEKAPGYLGTRLRPVKRSPGEYEVIDYWDSRAAWDAFRRDSSDAYERLDREAESLTTEETLVSEQELERELGASRKQLLVAAFGGALIWLEVGRISGSAHPWLSALAFGVLGALGFAAVMFLSSRYLLPPLFRVLTVHMLRRNRARALRDQRMVDRT